jgi:N-acetylglucosamine-6-phosphate deacetylase
LVADGIHLDPYMVTTVFELVGCENIALVTDSMAAAGLADGTYSLGGAPVTVANNVARLDRTGAIAGGTATVLDVLRSTVKAGVDIQDAVASATSVPATVLGLAADIGSLKPGSFADALIVNAELELNGVLRHGAWVKDPAEDVETTSRSARL